MLRRGFMEDEIEDTPRAINELIRRIDEYSVNLARMLEARRVRRIFLTGCGSSFNSAYIASYGFDRRLFDVYSETSSSFVLYTEGLSSNDCIIGFSRSGETSETVWALEKAKSRDCMTVAVTNSLNSSMAKIADIAIPIHAGEERSVVMTKTFVNLALAGLYIGADISRRDQLIDEFKDLDKIASSILEESK
ncbi:MAG: SIS domain-containing protein, partial [Candidatus Bathyarchaeota archaeon]|nr:SIS domain-containing protein [Candidatus Bathyarchaeota archaeon]